MTKDKAIEILGLTPEYTEDGEPIGEVEARRLGIEALRTIQAERTIYGFERQGRLLGETEE